MGIKVNRNRGLPTVGRQEIMAWKTCQRWNEKDSHRRKQVCDRLEKLTGRDRWTALDFIEWAPRIPQFRQGHHDDCVLYAMCHVLPADTEKKVPLPPPGWFQGSAHGPGELYWLLTMIPSAAPVDPAEKLFIRLLKFLRERRAGTA